MCHQTNRVVTEARHSFWSHALRGKLSHRTKIIANENPQCLWTAWRPTDMGWYLRSALATFCTTCHELESPEKRKLNWKKKKCFYQIDYRQICRVFSWLMLDKRRGMGDETAKHKTGQAIKRSQKVLFLHGLCFSCSLEVPTLASLDDVL